MTSVLNGFVLPALVDLGVSSPQVALDEARFGSSPITVEDRDRMRVILSEGYNRQLLVICASSVAQALAVLLVWKKHQVTLP